MVKRIFDIVFSIGAIILLFPVFVFIWIIIRLESKGGAIFRQKRVGLNNRDFTLYKFRTMYLHSENSGQLTLGKQDPRITRTGRILRHYKLDEIPQLFNVLFGEMSIVGPRPEVRKYVNLYSEDQLKVLSVKPGITDYASVKYFHEGELLGKSATAESIYIQEIMPEKLRLNMDYVHKKGLLVDLRIIFITFIRFFG